MGYSLSTVAKSKAAQERMLAFMEKHYEPAWKVRGLKEGAEFISAPMDDLSYAHSKNQIGFDFNASGFEREYMFTVTHWMALKIGRLTDSAKLDDEDVFFGGDPAPFILYDGDDRWPVLNRPLKEIPKRLHWCGTDRLGMRRDKKYSNLVDEIMFKDQKLFWQLQEQATKEFGPPSPGRHDYFVKLCYPHLKEPIKQLRTAMERYEKLWNAQG
jgi:hypothetical protein